MSQEPLSGTSVDEVSEVQAVAPPTKKRFRAAINTEDIEVEMPDGKIFDLQLRELDGVHRDEYLDKQAARMSFDKKGRPAGLKPLPGQDSWIVERGLWVPGENRRATPAFVKQIAASTRSQMATEIRRLSNIQEGLDEESQGKMFTEAKND